MLEKLDAQQKLTANQWKIAFAATIGDMLDFFDFGLIAFVLAFIVKDWHLTFGESGMILLASGISAPFGSLLWGWAADKIGRRKAMIGTVLNGIVNLSGRGMLVVSAARQLGLGTPLLAYNAAPLKPRGPEKGALGPLS